MVNHLVKDDSQPHLGGNILEGDHATWEPELWEWLISKFAVETVLDVGCGSGFSTQWFRKAGVAAIGLDGLVENIARTGSPALLWDLTQDQFPSFSMDLVWCCEVVEHVDSQYLSYLLGALSVGRVIAMTHAGIGQGGFHHVNCQPSAYWIHAVEAAGHRYLEKETAEGRALCDPSHHFAKRGLIFERVYDSGY